MAEAILKDIAKKKNLKVNVKSAGIFANEGSPASKNAVISMGDIGLDIKNHISRPISIDLIEESDLILTMTMGHKDLLTKKHPKKLYKIFSLKEYSFGQEDDIVDPYGGSKREYDRARDDILVAIEEMYKHI